MRKLEDLRCSFCGKNQKEVKKLVAGPGVYMCDECVELCRAMMWGNGARPDGMVMLQVEDGHIVIVDEWRDARFPFSTENVNEEKWRRFCERVRQVGKIDFSQEISLTQETVDKLIVDERDWQAMIVEFKRRNKEEQIWRASFPVEIDWTSRDEMNSEFERGCEVELAKVRDKKAAVENRLKLLREQMEGK